MTRHTKKGITLVEAVVAVAVLGVMVAGILTGLIYARQQTAHNDDQTQISLRATGALNIILKSIPTGAYTKTSINTSGKTAFSTFTVVLADNVGSSSATKLDNLLSNNGYTARYVTGNVGDENNRTILSTELASVLPKEGNHDSIVYTLKACVLGDCIDSGDDEGESEGESDTLSDTDKQTIIGYYIVLRYFYGDSYIDVSGFASETGGEM